MKESEWFTLKQGKIELRGDGPLLDITEVADLLERGSSEAAHEGIHVLEMLPRFLERQPCAGGVPYKCRSVNWDRPKPRGKR